MCRYFATTFVQLRMGGKVTAPRGSVKPGNEAQIDYGKLGIWFDPRVGHHVAVRAFVTILACPRIPPCALRRRNGPPRISRPDLTSPSSKFEQANTYEDFDLTVSPKLPAAMLRDLAALRWLDAGKSVILI